MSLNKRVIILTGSETRHTFVRLGVALTPGVTVLRSYCEGVEKSLETLFSTGDSSAISVQRNHIEARSRSEEDFFGSFVRLAPDLSNPFQLPKGAINDQAVVDEIVALCPDVIVAYGCSLIRGPLLDAFPGRFINAHLGLSPYYRGAGTNFWALVNGEPECVGATFMHIDAGVDTGAIIHQMRARVFPGDTPHQIGNRLIADLVPVYAKIIIGIERLQPPSPLPKPAFERLYRMADFTDDAVQRLYDSFSAGLVERYLVDQDHRVKRIPILENPGLQIGVGGS
ncbi:formyl transferase [Azospirillum sp.]|uniref:formyl transferase n=1 Tax=Azospirillum sp. TaxID=34012 RepID=UPI00262EDCFA|nr:formyl transferase [Azospirillum sp.]